MKKILVSLSIIGVVGLMAIGGTMSFFSDSEESTGNTFSAGEIDLKIDYRCAGTTNCGWPLKDLVAHDSFFDECDVKPGDSKSSTISWHVFNNNAWGRLKIANLIDWEYYCNEPEELVDSTCGVDEYDPGQGLGELSDNLYFTLWMDEGGIAGWQCPTKAACIADPQEGDGIRNGVETAQTPFLEQVSVKNFPASGIDLPNELIALNTYYVGIKWEIPSGVENIIQTDSINIDFVMEAVQSRNNLTRVFP